MTLKNVFSTAAALSLGVLPLVGGPVLAQEVPAQEAPTQEQTAYSDETLAAFVTAVLEIGEIQSAYEPQLLEAESEAAQVELHEQANEEMIVAIEDIDGISPDEYLEIASAATNDPALNERIVTLMETDPTSLQ